MVRARICIKRELLKTFFPTIGRDSRGSHVSLNPGDKKLFSVSAPVSRGTARRLTSGSGKQVSKLPCTAAIGRAGVCCSNHARPGGRSRTDNEAHDTHVYLYGARY